MEGIWGTREDEKSHAGASVPHSLLLGQVHRSGRVYIGCMSKQLSHCVTDPAQE